MKKIIIFLVTIICTYNVIYTQNNIEKLEAEVFVKIGESHNMALDQFFQACIDHPNYVTNLESLYERIDNFPIAGIEKPSISSKILLEGNLQQNQKIHENYLKLKEILYSDFSSEQLKNSIIKLKEDLMNDASLNSTEFNSIMAMYVVAEYSSLFWMPIERGGSGKGIEMLKTLNGKYPSLVFVNSEELPGINWPSTRAEKDAMGAAIGALQWCVTGSIISPGVGTAAGFIGGAVFGAFAGSVKACNPEGICRYTNPCPSFCCGLNLYPPLNCCSEN